MGTQLSPKDMRLYRLVDEILFYKWDPIGVSDSPWARDEYQAYLPEVFHMLKENKSAADFAKYLSDLRTGHIGLSSPQEKEDLKIAELLLKTRQMLLSKD